MHYVNMAAFCLRAQQHALCLDSRVARRLPPAPGAADRGRRRRELR